MAEKDNVVQHLFGAEKMVQLAIMRSIKKWVTPLGMKIAAVALENDLVKGWREE